MMSATLKAPERACKGCGAEIPAQPAGPGRPKVFHSRECRRNYYHRQEQAAVEAPARCRAGGQTSRVRALPLRQARGRPDGPRSCPGTGRMSTLPRGRRAEGPGGLTATSPGSWGRAGFSRGHLRVPRWTPTGNVPRFAASL
jgi:hypothetical protein